MTDKKKKKTRTTSPRADRDKLGAAAKGRGQPPAPPIFQTIKNAIAADVQSGRLKPGDRVESEHELVRRFGVSRMTVNRALRDLTHEGIIRRVRGVGSFAVEPRIQAELLAIRNIAEEIRERGHVHSCRLVEKAELPADAVIAETLEVPIDTLVYHTVLVHTENDIPIQIEDRWVNPAVAPGYLEVDFSTTTPNEYLSAVAPVSEVEHVIEAVLADRRAHRFLNVAVGDPCLRLFRQTWSSGRKVSCAWLIYPGRLYRMTARFPVGPGAR